MKNIVVVVFMLMTGCSGDAAIERRKIEADLAAKIITECSATFHIVKDFKDCVGKLAQQPSGNGDPLK